MLLWEVSLHQEKCYFPIGEKAYWRSNRMRGSINWKFQSLCRDCFISYLLTGTPLENRINELYSIFQFIDLRILGPLWHFNDRFYEPEKRESGTYKVLGYKNIDQLRALIKPCILRRTRDEVLKDLPPRTDNNFFVEMTDEQWDAYNEFREKLVKLISLAKHRPLTPKERELLLMYLIKMRLICKTITLHDKEIELTDSAKTGPKLGGLEEILAEEIASNGHKAVIFSQWANMLALTEPIIQRVGLGYVKLTGAVPSAKRGEDLGHGAYIDTYANGVLYLESVNKQLPAMSLRTACSWRRSNLPQLEKVRLIGFCSLLEITSGQERPRKDFILWMGEGTNIFTNPYNTAWINFYGPMAG